MTISKQYQLVILDRDGVINHDSDDYIKSPKEWHAINGSLAAIARLNEMDIKVAVASNQSGVSRGYFDLNTLGEIHRKMLDELKQQGGYLDELVFCTDHPDQPTQRRKPNPGMLLEISEHLNVSLSKTLFIGDSYSDYQAAQKGECDFALVRTGKGERTLKQHPELSGIIPIFENLAAVVNHIV